MTGVSWPRLRRRARSATTTPDLRPPSLRSRGLRLCLVFLAALASGWFLAPNELESSARALRQSVYAQYNAGATSMADWARQQVVVVRLSDESFDSLGLPPPVLPRRLHAKVIEELSKAGAKAIGFDLLFHIPREEDAVFAQAARASGRVCWAAMFEPGANNSQKIVVPNAQLLRANPHFGHIQMPLGDDDGRIDRVEPVIEYRARGKTQLVPAFSLELVRIAAREADAPLLRTANAWRSGRLQIPLDDEKKRTFKIKFYGKHQQQESGANPGVETESSPFFEVPFEDVVRGLDKDEFYRNNRIFQNKIVIIGNATTAAGDEVATPLGQMWGPEVHAHAVATLLEGSYTRAATTPEFLSVLAFVIGGLCVLGIFARWKWIAPSALLLLVGYGVFDIWIFVRHNLELPLVSPLFAIALAAVAILVERGVLEEKERKRATALLQRHLSPQIANFVLSHPETLHTRRVSATVLFSDIRGFTSLSEQLSPEQVVERLNEYLQAMTDAVFQNEGALDKFVGDAIMALYNTPVAQPDHARRAVATAIDMQTALLRLQAKWRAEGLPIIDIGIGINTGEMVAGYMGARQRNEFTVIGDAVNLASRVESLNKEMQSRILITEATYLFVQDEIEVRGPLRAQVKGKQQEVVVYEVFCWKQS